MKSHKPKSYEYQDGPTQVFRLFPWPKIILIKYNMQHIPLLQLKIWHFKCTHFHECSKSWMPECLCLKNKSVMDNSFDIKNSRSAWFWFWILFYLEESGKFPLKIGILFHHSGRYKSHHQSIYIYIYIYIYEGYSESNLWRANRTSNEKKRK
jgi:hypothetical protein